MMSGSLEWHVDGPVGNVTQNIDTGEVTSDGSDYVFLCNNAGLCLQMFSADGAYIGDVVRNDEEDFGRPTLVSWNNNDRSLLVDHLKNGRLHISSIKLDL